MRLRSAYGRKRTLKLATNWLGERPLLGKADIPGVVRNLHKIDQIGTSGFRSEADIELNWD
jgi:hypothetical protein